MFQIQCRNMMGMSIVSKVKNLQSVSKLQVDILRSHFENLWFNTLNQPFLKYNSCNFKKRKVKKKNKQKVNLKVSRFDKNGTLLKQFWCYLANSIWFVHQSLTEKLTYFIFPIIFCICLIQFKNVLKPNQCHLLVKFNYISVTSSQFLRCICTITFLLSYVLVGNAWDI